MLHQFDLQFELPLIGVDEVGRGCLAGPVFAGAVHFPKLKKPPAWLKDVTDSKKLSIKQRAHLAEKLKGTCFFAIGEASCSEINELGILPSTLLAMRRAVRALLPQISPQDFLVLVDGISKIKDLALPQKTLKKGDATSLHIAAASILAKVSRDQHMQSLSQLDEYRHFGWERNAGYGTTVHRQAILEHGPTDQHRQLFIRKVLGTFPCRSK